MRKINPPKGKVLQKDIIIPAGTIFWQEPNRVLKEYFGNDNFTHLVGLTDDSTGEFTYSIDHEDPELSEWFKDYYPNKAKED